MSDDKVPQTHPKPDLGRIGLWSGSLDGVPGSQVRDVVQEIEALGFGTYWYPETVGREAFVNATMILSSSTKLKAATGIASIAARTAMAMQAGWKALSEAYPERFILGMGVSHGHMVTKLHKSPYEKPYSTMVEYLDNMDSVPYFGVAPTGPLYRVLAALGPKMLELSRDRTMGAHPYFTTPAHTAEARAILGPDKLLAPEQMVIFETDSARARETARKNMSVYTRLPNYANNLMRLGFSADEIKEQSDRLVDEIVCWGTLDKIAARIGEHHDAGADHVCVQVLMHEGAALPMAQWRELAQLLR